MLKRKLLEMSENELEAVVRVILPGRSFEKCSKSDLQEAAIHWALSNGLKVTHEFTLIKVDDNNYGLLTDKDGCTCCQRSVPSHGGTFQRVEEGDAKRESENNAPTEMNQSIVVEDTSQIKSETNIGSKPAIISRQPLPTCLSLSDATKNTSKGLKISSKENTSAKQRKSGLSECCAEFGSCCISLFSNC